MINGDGDGLVSFSDIHLVGGRFDRPGLPLESVHELERYNRIVTEVAKGLWRTEANKKKLPAGFSDSLSLRLQAVRKGSVIPIITRDDAALFPVLDVLERAREIVDDEFRKIVDGEGTGEGLPATAQAPLRRLGSSFSDREAMLLRADSTRPIRWDQGARRRYLSVLDNATVEQSGPLVGTIRALDSQDFTFKMTNPADGRFIPGKFTDVSLYEDLHDHERQDDDVFVRLEAEYRTTVDGELIDILDVSSVEPFLTLDDPGGRRLVDLSTLRVGWLDGTNGESIELSAIEFARDVLSTLQEGDVDYPRIYPTPQGGVQLEWHDSANRVELTIEPDLSFESFGLMRPGAEELGRIGRGVTQAADAVYAAMEGKA